MGKEKKCLLPILALCFLSFFFGWLYQFCLYSCFFKSCAQLCFYFLVSSPSWFQHGDGYLLLGLLLEEALGAVGKSLLQSPLLLLWILFLYQCYNLKQSPLWCPVQSQHWTGQRFELELSACLGLHPLRPSCRGAVVVVGESFHCHHFPYYPWVQFLVQWQSYLGQPGLSLLDRECRSDVMRKRCLPHLHVACPLLWLRLRSWQVWPYLAGNVADCSWLCYLYSVCLYCSKSNDWVSCQADQQRQRRRLLQRPGFETQTCGGEEDLVGHLGPLHPHF